jgi:hypothetical protein
MICHCLRMFQGAVAFQIVGNAGRAQRMIADLRLDTLSYIQRQPNALRTRYLPTSALAHHVDDLGEAVRAVLPVSLNSQLGFVRVAG